MTIRPYRSALYMPGSNARAIEKSRTLAADVVIFDLEDAVAPEHKDAARAQVAAAVTAGGFGRRAIAIRINALSTPWGRLDLESAAKAAPDAILLPKPDTAADIDHASDALRGAGAPVKTKLWAMIETPRSILEVAAIAAASKHAGSRLSCLILGTNDLVKETGAELDADRTAALFWLSTAVTAARAYGLIVLDGVYNNFKDLDGLDARMPPWPHARLRRQNTDPPRSDRRCQRRVRTLRGRRRLGEKNHRRLRSAGEPGQGCHYA